LEICSGDDKPMAQWNEMDFLSGGVCQGFMMGFRDGIGIATATIQQFNPTLNLKGSAQDLNICVPDGVVLSQLIRVTLKYIREHPEQAHLPSATLVTLAEFNAFPCAKPKK
jgi:hypothetical protein